MNLTDPGVLAALLARHGLRAQKGLGQHFLTSATVVRRIVDAVAEAKGILEIGPGPGVLTRPLSETATLRALEFDSGMVPVLAESAPKAEVVAADALKADLRAHLQALPAPRAVVSNLPYYITGPLLEKIGEAWEHWGLAVLMMQREVGNRILAPPGHPERGALSVCLQAQFELRKLCDVPAGAFTPPPKVESVVLVLRPHDLPVPVEHWQAWRGLVRSCFRMPRKTIANNLAATVGKTDAERILSDAGIDRRLRPQALDQDAWTRLFHHSRVQTR